MTKSILALLILNSFLLAAQDKKDPGFPGNPVFPGWYADPEAIIYGNSYWIFPIWSDGDPSQDPAIQFTDFQLKVRKNTINPQYLRQTFLDAFSSKDLVHWEKHPHVLEVKNISWAGYAIWAPSVTKKGDKYFLFFDANDIQNNEQRRYGLNAHKRTRLIKAGADIIISDFSQMEQLLELLGIR